VLRFGEEHRLRKFKNQVLRKIFVFEKEEATGSGINFKVMRFMICDPRQLLFG
jgi:hypothetical protein